MQQKNSVLLPSYERTSFIREIREQHKEIETGTHTDIKVRITGRIMNVRSFGKLLFYDLQDESGKIQLLIDNKDITKLSKAVVKNLDVGDIVGCQGDIMSTKKGELSIKIYEIQLLMGVGVAAGIGQIGMTKAFHAAKAAYIGAFSYSTVVVSWIYGLFIFDEILSAWDMIGTLLIVGSGIILATTSPKTENDQAP